MDQQNSSHDAPTPDAREPERPAAGPRPFGPVRPDRSDAPAEPPFGYRAESRLGQNAQPLHGAAESLYGESADEEALRALMHDAVRDLQGAPDALDHLRRAIPVRRQRRRQAMVGAAATLVLAAMAIPALVHAAGESGGSAAAPAGVASSQTARPGEDGHARPSGGPSGQAATSGPGGTPTQAHPTTGPGGQVTPSATPTETGSPTPDCSSAQLGQGASSADAPDANGRVYGWFRVANVSGTTCTVPSGGLVHAVAQGSADASRIQVVGHTAGDPATSLPAATDGPVVLKPGEDYEVAFAWVPAVDGPGGCTPPTTPPASPTPTDTATSSAGGTDAGTGSAAGPGAATGADTPQPGSDPTTPPPGSVALNHTPAAGAPVVDGPVIQNACAGTVYTTSAIPESTGTPAP
jgi:hypothetical protein